MEKQQDKSPVLITGSSGAIGSALTAALQERFDVVSLDRDCRKSAARCIAMDLTSDEQVSRALAVC
jgi:nucleoside-diphosphate-sugar epimerase